jgi:hypothetical protein
VGPDGVVILNQRFGEGDLASILAANPDPDPAAPAARQAGEDKSLTQGTAGWAALGATPNTTPPAETHRDSNSHRHAAHQRAAHDLEDNQ